MTTSFKATALAIGTTALFTFVGTVQADSDHGHGHALTPTGAILPLESILDQARTDQPGRVIRSELERRGEGYVYEIRIADARGAVSELKYDARSGALIKRESKRSHD